MSSKSSMCMVNISISKSEQFSNYHRGMMKRKEKYSPLGAHKRLEKNSLSSKGHNQYALHLMFSNKSLPLLPAPNWL